ncbi:MAG: hypothetical protein P8L78_15655 [Mariniblastus sp.]|nr:hypothetical protein [Mariniblastus sp.]MDG2183125.1 hypothetical protein [Mariniblastus sp.]
MKFSFKLCLPCTVMALAFLLCATDVMAQPGGGRGGRGGRGGGEESSSRLLRNEAVQKDLELSGDQIELIEGLSQGRGGDRESIMAELDGLSGEERMEKMREMRDRRTAEMKKELDDILLPHQIERLEQIANQASAQGGARSLMGGSLADKLGITADQKERLSEKAEELQKEMNEKIAKLRAEMQDELLGELTADQRAQYKEMMGDAFKFERSTRGGPGGDRGGAGGDRGGNRGGDRGSDRGGNRGGDRSSDF